MTDRLVNKHRAKSTPTFWNTLWNWSVEGRATRTEYWTFAIISAFILLALIVAAVAASDYNPNIVLILAAGIFLVLSQISWVCVFIRRMHDSSRSGSYIIFPIIYGVCGVVYGIDQEYLIVSLVGFFCLLYTIFLLCAPSTPRRNKHSKH